MINFTPEQRQSLHETEAPIPARDPETQQEYVILQREVFEKIKRVLNVNEVDPSFFEYEELDTVVDAPRML